jgi:hypothetical protein
MASFGFVLLVHRNMRALAYSLSCLLLLLRLFDVHISKIAKLVRLDEVTVEQGVTKRGWGVVVIVVGRKILHDLYASFAEPRMCHFPIVVSLLLIPTNAECTCD